MTASGDTGLPVALALLSADLGDPSTDVSHAVSQLTEAARAAVPSYCGLSITVATDGFPVTITAPDDDSLSPRAARPVVTSLLIPLATLTATAVGELVLFASVAGAFVDLAADLAYQSGTALDVFVLDTRLDGPSPTAVGVGGLSVFNQAVGVLLERGHTPKQARARIARIAAQDGHDLVAAAERVINDDQKPPGVMRRERPSG